MKKYLILVLIILLTSCALKEEAKLETSGKSELETLASQITVTPIFEDDEVSQVHIYHELPESVVLRLNEIEVYEKTADGSWVSKDSARGLMVLETSLYPNQVNEVASLGDRFSDVSKGTDCKLLLPMNYLGEKFEETVYFTK